MHRPAERGPGCLGPRGGSPWAHPKARPAGFQKAQIQAFERRTWDAARSTFEALIKDADVSDDTKREARAERMRILMGT